MQAAAWRRPRRDRQVTATSTTRRRTAAAKKEPAPPAASTAARGVVTPPSNLEAEELVLGAALRARPALEVLTSQLRPEDFYKPRHVTIARAIASLAEEHALVEDVTVAAYLEREGALADVGGRTEITRIAMGCPSPANAAHYAHLVDQAARLRRLIAAATEITAAGYRADNDAFATIAGLLEHARGDVDRPGAGANVGPGFVAGGSFVFDGTRDIAAAWGDGDDVLWASGEPLLLVGPQGVGKTTLAQQLALARMGFTPKVLGWPVQPGAGRVLYIAADRPEQTRRSLQRMVSADHRPLLDDLLVVWRGPLPDDLARRPQQLADMARAKDADTVVVDSLKDVAVKLNEDEVGGLINRAFQAVVSSGIELLGLHHQRKEQRGAGKPKALADVYGSTWITGGCGSVLLLWGEPGDAVIDLSHLKQPAGEVGPVQVLHDQHTGVSTVLEQIDIHTLLRTASDGITVLDAATTLHGAGHSQNHREKTRRALESLVRSGKAHKVAGARGGGTDRDPSRYYLVVADPEEEP